MNSKSQTSQSAVDSQSLSSSASAPAPGPASPVDSFINSKNKANVPKKLSKKLKIILTACSIFFLLLVAVVAWYFLYYSNPDKAALDAVSKYLSTEKVATTGTITVAPTEQPQQDSSFDPAKSSYTLKIDQIGKGIPQQAKYSLSMNSPAFEDAVSLSLSESITPEGGIFFEVDGLLDVVKKLSGLKVEGPETATIVDFIKKIDGQWLFADIKAITKTLKLSQEEQDNINQIYTCVVDVAKQASNSQELAELYRSHPFINVSKYTEDAISPSSWHTLYGMTPNQTEFTKFANGIKETKIWQDHKSCLTNNKLLKDSDLDYKVESEKVDKVFKTLPQIIVEINNFSHQLSRVYLTTENSGLKATVDLNFSYPAALEVNTPEEYKPVTEIIDEIFKLNNSSNSKGLSGLDTIL